MWLIINIRKYEDCETIMINSQDIESAVFEKLLKSISEPLDQNELKGTLNSFGYKKFCGYRNWKDFVIFNEQTIEETAQQIALKNFRNEETEQCATLNVFG